MYKRAVEKTIGKDKQLARDERRKKNLNSIKHELETCRATSFDQIFAIMTKTRLSIEMNITFYAFRKKVFDPGEFTLNEVIRLAALFGVKYDTMHDWLKQRIGEKSKNKVLR